MNAWSDLRRLPRGIWAVALSSLVNRLGSMVVPFLALYLIREKQFTPGEAGAVLSLYGLAAVVVGPLAGRLVDRVGAVRVMLGALVLAGLFQLLYPLADSVAAIVLVTIALGAAAEAYRPAVMTVIADLVPAEQSRSAYALVRLAINLGMSIGPAAGGFLAMWSFKAIFIVDGVTTLIGAGVLAAARLRPPIRHRPRGEAAAPIWIALADRRFRGFLLGLFAINIVSFQGESTMPIYLVGDLGLAESTYGLLFTVNTILIVLLEVPLTVAIRTAPMRRTMVLGSLAYAVGFGALAIATDTPTVLLTVVIWTFGEMLLSPTASAFVAELAPPEKRGAYMGLFTASFSLAFVVAPWLGTQSLQGLGGTGHWVAMFALGLAATGLVALGASPAPKSGDA